MKRITITAKTDLDLADALETAARQIRIEHQGGNWKLCALMKKRGLSDRGLADAMGTTLQAVYFWRRGKRTPPKETQAAIAAVLFCSVADLGFPPVRGRWNNFGITPLKRAETSRKRTESGRMKGVPWCVGKPLDKGENAIF